MKLFTLVAALYNVVGMEINIDSSSDAIDESFDYDAPLKIVDTPLLSTVSFIIANSQPNVFNIGTCYLSPNLEMTSTGAPGIWKPLVHNETFFTLKSKWEGPRGNGYKHLNHVLAINHKLKPTLREKGPALLSLHYASHPASKRYFIKTSNHHYINTNERKTTVSSHGVTKWKFIPLISTLPDQKQEYLITSFDPTLGSSVTGGYMSKDMTFSRNVRPGKWKFIKLDGKVAIVNNDGASKDYGKFIEEKKSWFKFISRRRQGRQLVLGNKNPIFFNILQQNSGDIIFKYLDSYLSISYITNDIILSTYGTPFLLVPL